MNDLEFGGANAQDIEYMDLLDVRLSKNPCDFDALLRKAILSFEPFRRYEEGEALFDLLIKKDPLNVDAYFWLGECLYGCTSNHIKGEASLRSALAINPNRADCHRVLGGVLERLRQNKNEIEFHYRKAIELEPSWPAPRRLLVNLLIEKDDLEQACVELKQALLFLSEEIENPLDPVMEYYEELVTGRWSSNIKGKFTKRLKEIEAAITEKNKTTS